MTDNIDFLLDLERIVRQRIAEPGTHSYTAKLVDCGVRQVAQKLGEEAVEVALASVDEASLDEFHNEVADLIYHLLVLLSVRDTHLHDVVALLKERHQQRENL